MPTFKANFKIADCNPCVQEPCPECPECPCTVGVQVQSIEQPNTGKYFTVVQAQDADGNIYAFGFTTDKRLGVTRITGERLGTAAVSLSGYAPDGSVATAGFNIAAMDGMSELTFNSASGSYVVPVTPYPTLPKVACGAFPDRVHDTLCLMSVRSGNAVLAGVSTHVGNYIQFQDSDGTVISLRQTAAIANVPVLAADGGSYTDGDGVTVRATTPAGGNVWAWLRPSHLRNAGIGTSHPVVYLDAAGQYVSHTVFDVYAVDAARDCAAWPDMQFENPPVVQTCDLVFLWGYSNQDMDSGRSWHVVFSRPGNTGPMSRIIYTINVLPVNDANSTTHPAAYALHPTSIVYNELTETLDIAGTATEQNLYVPFTATASVPLADLQQLGSGTVDKVNVPYTANDGSGYSGNFYIVDVSVQTDGTCMEVPFPFAVKPMTDDVVKGVNGRIVRPLTNQQGDVVEPIGQPSGTIIGTDTIELAQGGTTTRWQLYGVHPDNPIIETSPQNHTYRDAPDPQLQLEPDVPFVSVSLRNGLTMWADANDLMTAPVGSAIEAAPNTGSMGSVPSLPDPDLHPSLVGSGNTLYLHRIA